MNRDEFDQWLDVHKKFYPGLSSWFARNKASSDDIMQSWHYILANVDYEAACQASRELVEAPVQPRSFDRHPVEVKKLAAKRKPAAFAGPRPSDGTVRCTQCNDSGLVAVAGLVVIDNYEACRRSYITFSQIAIVNHVLSRRSDNPNARGCDHEFGIYSYGARCSCDAGLRPSQNIPQIKDGMVILRGCPVFRRDTRFWESLAEQLQPQPINERTEF